MVDFCDLVAKVSTIGLGLYGTFLYPPYSLLALPFALPSMLKFSEEVLVDCGIVTATDAVEETKSGNGERKNGETAETVAQDDDKKVAEALKDVKETWEELTKTYAELLFLDHQKKILLLQMKEELRQYALKITLVTEETEKVLKTEKTKKDSVFGKTAETAAPGENVVVPGEGKDEEKVAEAASKEVLCKVKEKKGYVSEETKDISSDSDETIEISYDSEETIEISFDSEDSDDKVDVSKCDEKDISLVIEHAKVTRSQAVKALLRNNNQCFEASVELVMKKLGFVQNH